MYVNSKVIDETLFFNSISHGIFDFKISKEKIEATETEGISEALMEYLIYLIISKRNRFVCNFIIVSPEFLLHPNTEERKLSFMSPNVFSKKYIIVPTRQKESKEWSLVIFENAYMNCPGIVYCHHISDYLKEKALQRSNIKVILEKKTRNIKKRYQRILLVYYKTQ